MIIEKDFDHAVSLFGKDVEDHVKKLNAKDLKPSLLFRLDDLLPKVFIPRMPKSAASSENSTVPRVVTATTILGCMCGHAGMIWNVLERDIGKRPCNHYKLSAFNFEKALFPDKTLVFDAEDTQETWLIAYDKSTIAYQAFHYGEIFFHKVSVTTQALSKIDKTVADILVEVIDVRGIYFSEGIFLEKGHYYIKLDVSNYAKKSNNFKVKRMTYRDSDKVDVMKISPSVYKSFRDISVGK